MSEERIQVLLFGLGAIGSFYAFILGRNRDVELSVVARSNYEAVKTNGLKIESEFHGDHMVEIDHVYKNASDAARKFDIIVCANKAIDLSSIPPLLQEVVDEDTIFAFVQNGVGNEEPFRIAFPKATLITCVVWVGANQPQPGIVKHNKSEHTEIGLFRNPSLDLAIEEKRLETFATLLRNGGTKYSIENEIQTKRWEKVVWNCAWNPLTALTQLDTHSWLSSSAESTPMTRRLMLDVIRVARSCGVPLEDGLADVLIQRVLALDPLLTSMSDDAKHGRRLEIEVILGYPMKKARESGLDVPTLSAVYSMITALDLNLKGRVESV